MKFNFKAKAQSGGYEEGVIEASSKEMAIVALQKKSLLPISIREESRSSDLVKTILKYYDRVAEAELVVFFRQLAILIEARVPVVVSLSAIQEQTINKYFFKVIGEMINDVEDGVPFSSAMEKQKNVFSDLSINIIRAGEASGNLKKSVDYVATNIEKNYTLSSRVKSALMYPMIVLIVFFIIGFLVIAFVIPNLTSIIKEINADVPWYTSLVMVVADFMKSYWWAIAIVILSFVGVILYYIRTKDGIKEWDRIKINLPIVGPIYRFVYITRFAENFGVLLSGGIPIIRALTISSSVINNIYYEEVLLLAAEEVKRGGNMSAVFKRSTLIPPMVTHMVKIGEESGQIDSVLGHIARFYDQEVEVRTRNLSTLLEPILMIFIGIAVGFMAFAILMPIYNIAGQIQ